MKLFSVLVQLEENRLFPKHLLQNEAKGEFPLSRNFLVRASPPGGGVLLGIPGGGVPPGTPISDQKCNFPHPFSDQTSKIHTRFQIWPLGRNYVIIT